MNYPVVVQNYRSARDIFVRHSSGRASTEDLRQAMVYYRSLFDELLGTPAAADPQCFGAPRNLLLPASR